MTIESLIRLGDELKAMLPEMPKTQAYEAPPSVLPPGCPLYTSTANAGELFGMGEQTMRLLIRDNADFPALRLGKKIIVDVPGLYKWLTERNGTNLRGGDDE